MKKFQFELEEILNIRKFEQQQAEIELGKALASENEIQSKLNALAMQQASVQKQLIFMILQMQISFMHSCAISQSVF